MAPFEHAFILELMPEQIAQQPVRKDRRRLAISGKALVRRYRVDLLKDRGQVVDLMALTSFLAKDNPLFAAA